MDKAKKESLKKIAEAEVEKLKHGKPRDTQGNSYEWDEGKRCFQRIDEKGQLWVKGINTSVPAYWSYCSNDSDNVDINGFSLKCNTPHFVFIYEDGEEKVCDECKRPYKIVITLPKES